MSTYYYLFIPIRTNKGKAPQDIAIHANQDFYTTYEVNYIRYTQWPAEKNFDTGDHSSHNPRKMPLAGRWPGLYCMEARPVHHPAG
jgi:hypothetical protein